MNDSSSQKYEDDIIVHDPKCDCYSHPTYYNNYNLQYDEDYYYHLDFKIDFYDYLENKCLKFQHFENIFFNDEILNLNLLKLKVEPNNKYRVNFLLELLNRNLNNYTDEQNLKLLKSLFCWQAQFNDVKTIEHIAKFALENNLCNDMSRLGDFTIDSNETSTLNYSIHSHQLEMVKAVIEKYGANCNAILKNGTTAVHYAVMENVPVILRYLMKTFSINNSNFFEMLEFNDKTKSPLELAIEGKKYFSLKMALLQRMHA